MSVKYVIRLAYLLISIGGEKVMKRSLIYTAVFSAMLMVTGCGGGGDSDSGNSGGNTSSSENNSDSSSDFSKNDDKKIEGCKKQPYTGNGDGSDQYSVFDYIAQVSLCSYQATGNTAYLDYGNQQCTVLQGLMETHDGSGWGTDGKGGLVMGGAFKPQYCSNGKMIGTGSGSGSNLGNNSNSGNISNSGSNSSSGNSSNLGGNSSSGSGTNSSDTSEFTSFTGTNGAYTNLATGNTQYIDSCLVTRSGSSLTIKFPSLDLSTQIYANELEVEKDVTLGIPMTSLLFISYDTEQTGMMQNSEMYGELSRIAIVGNSTQSYSCFK